MDNSELKKLQNIFAVLEEIKAELDGKVLVGEIRTEHAVSVLNSDSLDYDDYMQVLIDLKNMGVLTYSDRDISGDNLVVIGSHELVLKIKAEAFENKYNELSEQFGKLTVHENEQMAKLSKEQLSSYKQFLRVVIFHLPYAKGQGACNLSLSIPFSDFKALDRIAVAEIADKISGDFLFLKRKEVELGENLELMIYVKKKLVEFARVIDEATKNEDRPVLGEISSLIITESPLSNDYKCVINGDYRNPLEISKSAYAKLLTQTAQNIPLEKKSHKNYFDYINSNRKNVFYKAGYQKTKILKEVNGYIMPAVAMEFVDERKKKSA
ncbi:MAG: hypothetical protein WCG01_01540 [bacterium]